MMRFIRIVGKYVTRMMLSLDLNSSKITTTERRPFWRLSIILMSFTLNSPTAVSARLFKARSLKVVLFILFVAPSMKNRNQQLFVPKG